ncbi:hypothetical protein LVB87_12655 [Lysobacter sp. KIS68-7]|nr:GTPase-associated system all-helical protein GASH [Lysobacter sp. KIS68-7]UHQ21145.1 hypothetical protein LVB87_12655 [Lysobacter sp. KIS68-7]
MHQDFARWYSAVNLGDDSSRRTARWNGVMAVVEETDAKLVEALVRLAFGGRALPSPQSVQTIRQSIRSKDDTFEMSGNDRELQILSAVTLVVLMEDVTLDADLASLAALAISTASFSEARKPELPMNLVSIAENAIVRLSDERRERPVLDTLMSSDPPKLDFEKAATKVREQPNWDGVAQAFELAAEASRIAMRTSAQRSSKAFRAFERFISIQDEELEMLWWLTGLRSEDYNCSFDAVPLDARPFVLAGELARATWALPGPRSISALLSRAGLDKQKPMTVPAALNGIRVEWLAEQVRDMDPSALTEPLHFAIKRLIETGPGDAWIAGWAAATEIDASRKMNPLTLAELFYRERLMLLLR